MTEFLHSERASCMGASPVLSTLSPREVTSGVSEHVVRSQDVDTVGEVPSILLSNTLSVVGKLSNEIRSVILPVQLWQMPDVLNKTE